MWLQQTTTGERRALLAAFLGYGVDGFDFMIYTFIIPTLLVAWHMSHAQAGYIATGALLTSAAGCCGMLGAYYSVTTWLPTFLKNERHLSVLGTSSYLLVLIAGSFAGYLAGAWLSDALGRRRCFILYAVCAALLVLGYTWMPISDGQMLLLGFLLGFFLSGINSGIGAFLAELYPSAVRGSGQGFCYSMGRAVGAFCPSLIGAWSAHVSLGISIGAMTAAAYGLVVVAAWVLPETRGRVLSAHA